MLSRLFILSMTALVILSGGMRARDEKVDPVTNSLQMKNALHATSPIQQRCCHRPLGKN
jgi:hypothetical protein